MPTKLLSTALSLVLVIIVYFSCAVCIPAQELADKSFGSRLFSQPASNVSARLEALPFLGSVLSHNQAGAQRSVRSTVSVQVIEPTNRAESSRNKNSSNARHLMEVRDSRLLVD